MKVKVYRNLRNGLFSVLDAKTNKVSFYASELVLKDATFVIQKGGQQRARATGQRNVHAYIKGFVTTFDGCECTSEVYYNPFETDYFLNDSEPIHKADMVLLKNNKCYVKGNI
ncbi:hypothetical protein NX029_26210 [Cytobacillus firmus]|nr:hypothetical protein [Cytobacillus firmus]